jgi:phage tail sheath gpL-like
VGELTGKGSILHGMMTAYQKMIPLRKSGSCRWRMTPDSMAVATGSIKVATQAAETGVISLYIAGVRVQLTVLATDTPAQIATALVAAITAKRNCR